MVIITTYIEVYSLASDIAAFLVVHHCSSIYSVWW